MADKNWIEGSFSDPYADPDPNRDGTGLSDYGAAFAQRTVGMGADLGAVVRALGESRDDPENKAGQAAEYLGKFAQNVFSEWENGIGETLSPDAADRLKSSVTDPNFWSLTTFALKGSSMAPDVVAAIIPARLFTGAMAATAIASIEGGTFSSAGFIDDVYKMTDALPDAKLQEESKYYRDLRQSGADEETARRQYNAEVRGMKPLMLAALGAVTNAVGPAGQAARGLGAKTGASIISEGEEGVVRRTVGGFAEGAGSEAIQSGAEAYANQDAAVTGGLQKEIDYGAVATGAAEGAVLGGALGGAISAASRRPRRTAVDEVLGVDPEATPDPQLGAPVTAATPGVSVVDNTAVAPVAPDGGPNNGPTADAQPAPASNNGVAVGPTIAQELQARKNFNKPYSDLTTGQQATLTQKVKNRGLQVVEPGAPNAEEKAAIASTKPIVTPQVMPEASTQVDPMRAAPPEAPAPAQPVVEAPVGPAQPQVTASAPRTSSQIQREDGVGGVEAMRRADAERAAASVSPSPVVDTAPVVEARPEPALAQPAPIVPAVEAGPRKPRILSSVKPEDVKADNEASAKMQARIDANLKAAEGPVEATPKGQNFTKDQLAERKATNETALRIAETYKPSEIDHDSYTANKPDKVTLARRAVLDRAKAMVKDANDAQIKIPAAIRDTTNAERSYNPETLLLVEARRLASKQAPSKADFQRFLSRELDIRAGAADEVKATRRAEGDAANRQTAEVQVDDVADNAADTSSADPEARLIAAEEEAETDRTPATAKEDNRTTAEKRQAEREAAPSRVTDAFDKAIAEATAPLRPAPKVEVKKTRKPAGKKTPLQERVERQIGAAKGDIIDIDGDVGGYSRPDKGGYLIEDIQANGVVHVRSDGGKGGATSWSKVDLMLAEKSGRKFTKRAPVTSEVTVPDTLYGAPNVTIKPTPKPVDPGERGRQIVADIKAKVEKARAETATAPTTAQVLAGNYAKGKASVHGMEISIENPKGSTRTNKNPEGPKWSVKMPADYGYINGTKGADGDAVDVYLGPDHDATYVYVVDQVDPDSRAFDEHKTLMGFKSQDAAIMAYDKAFSDGRGAERVGDIRKMTVAEFKEWVKSPAAKKPAGAAEADPVMSAMLDLDDLAGPVPEGMIRDSDTGEVATPISTTSAADIIGSLKIDHLSGAPRVIAGQARRLLRDLVGDVPVHIMSADNMRRLLGRDRPPKGYWEHANGQDRIVIREDQLRDQEALTHVVLHEAVHAATRKEIANSKSLTSIVDQLRSAVMLHPMMKDPDVQTILRYGLSDPYEFVAEAFSNPLFQETLASMPADAELVANLDLDRPGIVSMWDGLVNTIRRVLGMPKNTYTMLEAAIRVTESAMRPRTQEVEHNNLRSFLDDQDPGVLKRAYNDAVKSITERPDLAPRKGSEHLLGLRTLDNIARMADRYFGGNNPIRKVANLLEKQRTAAIAEIDRAAPVIQRLHDLQKKYEKVQKGATTVWADFAALVHDETMSGVYADRELADQKHISKAGKKDSWQRRQHADLSARYNALPQDLKDARRESMDYFTAQQNRANLQLIKNGIVRLFDVPDPDAMAVRIHENTTTDADKAILGDMLDELQRSNMLTKIQGPYVPLMRRGNFVVKGRYAITAPANAVRTIAPNEFEFSDVDVASTYAEAQETRPTIRTVYVDKNTGETYGIGSDGTQVSLTANDMNVERRYRVAVQDRHVEMFDTEKEARAQVAALRKAGMDVDDVEPRKFENFGIQGDALSTQMKGLVDIVERRADARNYTPEQKNDLISTMNEMALRVLSSTRVQSRHLPRTYVEGASRDFVRNTVDYSHSMSNYIAKIENRPAIDAALQDAEDYIKANSKDGMNTARRGVTNEVVRRMSSHNPASDGSKVNGVINRILAVSFIDKLASPAYSMINATQPMMITTPFLASRYGLGKASAAMARAYNDVGSMQAIKQGFRDTLDKARNADIIPTDPVSLIKGRLTSARERAMIDALVERGVIDTDSGLEVGKLVRDTRGIVGKLDGGIGYLEGISRQMPKAIEAINRSVSAVASYRLEMERSGDHDRAIQYAQDIINQTQFNYSASNTSPVFNHPVLRLALQFKKYGLGMYQLLGEQAARAIRNENPGDRAEAIKALSYTIGMHVLMAGAMGLPTEPIKMVVLAANGLGITDWGWADVEDKQRELAADIFGKDLGEIVSRGVTRAVGIDLSSRMGIDTLMGPFGEPRSNEAQDWKAYAWDAFSGAPAGLVTDWAKGINDLAKGDMLSAVEKLVPLKVFSDSVKAYRVATEGGSSRATGKQIMSPYTFGEAALRGVGFAPSREAESFERSSMVYRAKEQQNETRTSFQKEWTEATGAARGRLWREITKWNKSQPAEAKLTLDDLRTYQKRLKDDMKATKEGIRLRKREEHIGKRADETFNYMP